MTRRIIGEDGYFTGEVDETLPPYTEAEWAAVMARVSRHGVPAFIVNHPPTPSDASIELYMRPPQREPQETPPIVVDSPPYDR